MTKGDLVGRKPHLALMSTGELDDYRERLMLEMASVLAETALRSYQAAGEQAKAGGQVSLFSVPDDRVEERG